MRRVTTRLLAAAAVIMAALALAPSGAGAAAPGKAMIRIAHFSPDAAYVDVYVVSLNRNQLFPNVFYKNVSAYWQVNAGPFSYEVRAAGAPPSSKPAIRLTGRLQAGHAYTVAGVGPKTNLSAVLLSDDMAPTGAGRARVRFIDAAVDLPKVDVAVDGRVLSPKLSFAAPGTYRALPVGKLRVEARRSGGGGVLLRDNLRVRAGTVSSAVLLGGGGQPREVFAFSDASGVGRMPAGGIKTGAGGAARAEGTRPYLLLLAAGILLIAFGGSPRQLPPSPPSGPLPGSLSGPQAAAAGPCRTTFGPTASLLGPRAPSRRVLAAAALALVLAALLGGCGRDAAAGAGATGPVAVPAATADPAAPRSGGSGMLTPSARPAPPPKPDGFEVASPPSAVRVPGPPAPPVRLSIPAIGVATPLDRLGLAADGGMEVPADFARAGWFSGGTVPGQQGPAVIAGHVDSKTGPAVFYRLRELKPGDRVEVERADGVRLRFAVEGQAQYRKASLPTEAVFGPAPLPALRLVTCGGGFDRSRGSYRDNLVVFAHLIGAGR